MLARRAARQLAFLNLFQLDRGGVDKPFQAVSLPAEGTHALQETLLLNTVRSLTELTKETLEKGAEGLNRFSEWLDNVETEDVGNLNLPLGMPNQPVLLPKTDEVRQHVESCLKGAEFLWDAIELPELLALSTQEKVATYALTLSKLVIQHADTLDATINQYSEGWTISRMVKTDRNLLRLALVEMLYGEDVDLSVTINEMIELTKKFSTDESFRFVNSILGKLATAIENGELQRTPPAPSAAVN